MLYEACSVMDVVEKQLPAASRSLSASAACTSAAWRACADLAAASVASAAFASAACRALSASAAPLIGPGDQKTNAPTTAATSDTVTIAILFPPAQKMSGWQSHLVASAGQPPSASGRNASSPRIVATGLHQIPFLGQLRVYLVQVKTPARQKNMTLLPTSAGSADHGARRPRRV